MNSKNHNSRRKALIGGFVVSAAGLGMLTTSGCVRLPDERAAAVSAGWTDIAADQFGSAVKAEQRSKISINHNETFLTVESV